MIVSDNGAADPIVWIGAERDEKLHDFRGDAGQEVFTSDPLPGLRHFATVLAAVGRLYVAGDGRISVFGLALGVLSSGVIGTRVDNGSWISTSYLIGENVASKC